MTIYLNNLKYFLSSVGYFFVINMIWSVSFCIMFTDTSVHRCVCVCECVCVQVQVHLKKLEYGEKGKNVLLYILDSLHEK